MGFDGPRRGQAERTLGVRLPTRPDPVAVPVTPAPRAPQRRNWRVQTFRLLRLIVAATLLLAGGRFMADRRQFPVADEAYIQAEIVPVRSPIEGELGMHAGSAGATVEAGQLLFEVNNSRFGNREAPLQLHWARESVGRLEHETAEAAAQLQFHEKICQAHRELYREKLIPLLELLEHERKFETARSIATNRQQQLVAARQRRSEIEQQAELQKSAAVRAGFAGIVWSAAAQHGEQIAAGSTVVSVIDPSRLWIDALFPERHAARLKPGTAVRVTLPDQRGTWIGRIDGVRGGIGRIGSREFDQGPAGGGASYRKRVAVRIQFPAPNPFPAAEYFGVGRSVTVKIVAGPGSREGRP